MPAFRSAKQLARAVLLVSGVCIALAGEACKTQAGGRHYVLEAIPLASAPRTHEVLAPLARELAARSGLCLELHVPGSVSDFDSHFRAGMPDFAVANPNQVVASQRGPEPYVPLLRDAKARLVGLLVVRKDSPYVSLEDLQQREIGVPSTTMLASALLVRDLLNRARIQHTLVEMGTPASVLRGVLLGRVAAGGLIKDALEMESPELRANLRVMLQLPEQPPPALVAHPRVEAAARASLVQAVIDLAAEPAWRDRLSHVWLADPVAADYRRDYQGLERLKLQLTPLPDRP